jgi:hypothetical protein
MNSGRSVVRHLAVRLAAHAEKALPRSRADWASAMRNEVHHISGNRAALKWALGCVFASYTERMRTMIASNPRISRWVLVLEMLFCFTPLTWLCLATFANLGRMQGKTGIFALTVAAAGPIGLIVAFKVVVLNRPSLTKFAMAALCLLAAWTMFAYSLQILAEAEPGQLWREFVLIALLPALGVAHLLYLATRPTNKLAAT